MFRLELSRVLGQDRLDRVATYGQLQDCFRKTAIAVASQRREACAVTLALYQPVAHEPRERFVPQSERARDEAAERSLLLVI